MAFPSLIPNKLHPITGEDLKPTVENFWRDGVTPMSDDLCGGLYNKDTEPTSETFGEYFKWNSSGDYSIKRLTTVNQSNFEKLINDFGNSPVSLLIDKTLSIESNLEIPKNIQIIPVAQPAFNIAQGVTLTLKSEMLCADQFVFGGLGLVNLVNGNIYTGWMGCVGDGIVDDSVALQRLVSSAKNEDTITFSGDKTYRLSGISFVGKGLKFKGNKTTIYQKSEEFVFQGIGTWGSIKNVTAINNVIKSPVWVTELTVDSSGLDKGDIVKIFSEDSLPDGQVANRMVGEFALVGEVTPTTVVLQSYLRDFPLYKTNIRIAKLENLTCSFDDINFIPDPAVDSSLWNGSSGAEAFIRLSSFVNPTINNSRIDRSASNAFVLHSCYTFAVSRIYGNDLPDSPDIQKFGYAICDANSEGGIVDGCIFNNNRHGYTTNTYPIFTSDTNMFPANYGRTYGATVNHCIAFGGRHAGFDTHDGSRKITFMNCSHFMVGYRPQPSSAVYNGYSFQLRGSEHRMINCRSTGFNGVHVYTNSSITGGDIYNNWGYDLELIDCDIEATNNALFVEKAQFVKVKRGNYIKPSLFTNDFVIKVRNGSLLLEDVFVKSKNLASTNTGCILLRDSNLEIEGGTYDLSNEVLNESSQLVNYGNDFITITENLAQQQVKISKNTKIIAGRVPLNAFVNNRSANLFNTTVNIKDLEYEAIEGNVIISTGATVVNGNLATRGVGGTEGVPQSVYNYKNISYTIKDSLIHTKSNYKLINISTATQNMQDIMRSMNDDNLFIELNPTVNTTLNSFYTGKFIGQPMTIRNNSTAFNVTILSGITNIDFPGTIVIYPKSSKTLRYTSTGWSLDEQYSGEGFLRIVNGASTTLRVLDNIVEISNGTNRTVNLYDPTLLRGKVFMVKDGSLNAASFPISFAGYPIDGLTDKVINTNGGYLVFYSNGTSYFSLGGTTSSLIRTVVANATLTKSDKTILADATSGNITVNIVSAASLLRLGESQEFVVKKIDSSVNTVTIDPNGAELIDGASTYVLSTQWSFVRFQSNGTSLYITGKG